MNYSDPTIQSFLLRNAAARPWGGVANRIPGLDKLLQARQQRQLAMGEVGLRSQMNTAQIEQMKFNRDIATRRLGLEEGFLGLSQKEMGLKEKRLSLEEGYLGLEQKGMGLKEKRLGLAEQEQELRGSQASWRNSQFNKDIKQKEKELNLSTLLGIGTSAYGGWLSYQRNKEMTADRKATKEFNDLMRQRYLTK